MQNNEPNGAEGAHVVKSPANQTVQLHDIPNEIQQTNRMANMASEFAKISGKFLPNLTGIYRDQTLNFIGVY
jgi:hypothetical protein